MNRIEVSRWTSFASIPSHNFENIYLFLLCQAVTMLLRLLFHCCNCCEALAAQKGSRLRKSEIWTHLWFILLITIQLISENPITGQAHASKKISRTAYMRKGAQIDNVQKLSSACNKMERERNWFYVWF